MSWPDILQPTLFTLLGAAIGGFGVPYMMPRHQNPDQVMFGDENEWKLFAERHPAFTAETSRVDALAKLVFERSYSGDRHDHIIFSLGLLCWQDYQELILLAGNGMGFGALKNLRGFYERLVTLRYLEEHPEEIQAFRDFEHVRTYRVTADIHQQLGEAVMPKATVDELKVERDRVLPQFMRSCTCTKNCPHDVPMGTWTKLDPVAMAGKVDDGLRQYAYAGYYMPLMETHPTLSAMFSRQSLEESGLSFKNEKETARANASWCVSMAHTMVLKVFETEMTHFPGVKANGGTLLDEAKKAFQVIWAEGDRPNVSPAQ